MKPTKKEWKLPELAEAAGVSPRTVRYYVQRGLLPAPPFRGPDTAYGPEHLIRLKAIKRLQERYLPLDAIQVELARLSPAELERLAEGGVAMAAPMAMQSPPPPARSARPFRGDVWERVELAEGLELHIRHGADETTRRLAERLKQAAREEGARV